MRAIARVRAMVVRNTSSLDQMIGEALGDEAARLRAFGTVQEAPADMPPAPAASTTSGREQGDNVARARQRPNFETGML
jgi:hypothetical protein